MSLEARSAFPGSAAPWYSAAVDPSRRRPSPGHLTLLLLLAAGTACAQGWGRRFYFEPNSNNPPATELIAARWRFSTNGMIGHTGWSHNYPYSEQHLNEFVDNTTRIDVQPESYQLLDLGTNDIFDHPFTYVSEPGEMDLTPQEAENLREYVLRGGFILIDDFDGPWQLSNFQAQMRNVFPERGFMPLTIENPIFDLVFGLEDLMGTADYNPGSDPVFLGLQTDQGHLASVACFNNDLANFWDRIDQGSYPLRPSSDAFRMGINFIVYAMTH
jgi:hypothetical protein